MNEARNSTYEWEECTRTTPPYFFGDRVHLEYGLPEEFVKPVFMIDTVDVDGNDSYCRVQTLTGTVLIVPVDWLRRINA